MAKFRFKLDIGDFSQDGHHMVEPFIVECDKDIAAARDALFAIKPVTGVDVFSVCAYNDVIDPKTLAKLSALGYQFPVPLYTDDYGTHILDSETAAELPDVFADMLVFLLNAADKDLHATIVREEIPSLLFCGKDPEGRHCHSLGYGLFD